MDNFNNLTLEELKAKKDNLEARIWDMQMCDTGFDGLKVAEWRSSIREIEKKITEMEGDKNE